MHNPSEQNFFSKHFYTTFFLFFSEQTLVNSLVSQGSFTSLLPSIKLKLATDEAVKQNNKAVMQKTMMKWLNVCVLQSKSLKLEQV